MPVALAKMPFADNGCTIARRTQLIDEGGLSRVERRGQCGDLIHVTVRASQDAGPAWSAQRIGGKAVLETDAVSCDLVDARSSVDRRAVATDGVSGVVVTQDEDDIWPSGGAHTNSLT